MRIDLAMTTDGELIIGDDGDLATSYGDEQLSSEVLFRLKTQKGDWTLSPNTGCSLERFIGQPNTPLVRGLIESVVQAELTKDGLLIDPRITCMKHGDTEVILVIEFPSIEDSRRIVQVASTLDLRLGQVSTRIDYRTI